MRGQDVKLARHDDEFTEQTWRDVDGVISRYRGKAGSLIPVLEEIQGLTGYLPEAVQRRVSKGLGIPLSQVYGVVTFYSFFTMTPRGKHQVRVCLGTACHVRGGQAVVEKLADELGIKPGECDRDRRFSLDIVRCLGCCALAPVMVVGEHIHKQIKVAHLPQIMKKYQ